MQGFSVNYEAAASGSYQIEPGVYEVILTKPSIRETTWGVAQMDFPFVIRNDIQQPRQNQYIYHALSPKREPSEADMSVGGYSVALVQQLSKAAQLPNGKAYPSIQAWFDDMSGRPLRVTVESQSYQKRDGTFGERSRVASIEQTQFPQVNHAMKNAPNRGNAAPQPAPYAPPANYPPASLPQAPTQAPTQVYGRPVQQSFVNTNPPGFAPPAGFTQVSNEEVPF